MSPAWRRPVAALALMVGLAAAATLAPPAPAAAAETAGAAGAAPTLDSEAKREQARALFRGLRCVVCEGQSIAESEADLARQMRQIVRDKLAQGESPNDIRAYMVERYGDSVLWRPPLRPATVLLWAGPFLVLAAGAAGVALWYRRQRRRGLGGVRPPA